MSIVTQLTHNKTFIQEVKEQITAKIIDQQADVYTKDGLIEGTVTAYELQTEPEFDKADGISLEWSIPFHVTGEATIGYKTGDGEYGEGTTEGLCEGSVEVTFHDSTLAYEIDEIALNVEISVTIESAALDDKEPPIEPNIE